MNKCKDCEWYSAGNSIRSSQCRWKPTPIEIHREYGCGQWVPGKEIVDREKRQAKWRSKVADRMMGVYCSYLHREKEGCTE